MFLPGMGCHFLLSAINYWFTRTKYWKVPSRQFRLISFLFQSTNRYILYEHQKASNTHFHSTLSFSIRLQVIETNAIMVILLVLFPLWAVSGRVIIHSQVAKRICKTWLEVLIKGPRPTPYTPPSPVVVSDEVDHSSNGWSLNHPVDQSSKTMNLSMNWKKVLR